MSRTAYDLLQRLGQRLGIGRGAVLELALRELAMRAFMKSELAELAKAERRAQ